MPRLMRTQDDVLDIDEVGTLNPPLWASSARQAPCRALVQKLGARGGRPPVGL
jgi:hypothetical protein